MKVLIAENICFIEHEDPYQQEAEVFGHYQIVDMTEQEYKDYTDKTQDSWLSEEYNGKIWHVQEIKL